MTVLHFIYAGTEAEFRSSVSVSCERMELAQIAGVTVGAIVVDSHYALAAPAIAKLHSKLTVLPRPNRKMKPEHVAALLPVVPTATAGALFEAALFTLYSKVGSTLLNPESF